VPAATASAAAIAARRASASSRALARPCSARIASAKPRLDCRTVGGGGEGVRGREGTDGERGREGGRAPGGEASGRTRAVTGGTRAVAAGGGAGGRVGVGSGGVTKCDGTERTGGDCAAQAGACAGENDGGGGGENAGGAVGDCMCEKVVMGTSGDSPTALMHAAHAEWSALCWLLDHSPRTIPPASPRQATSVASPSRHTISRHDGGSITRTWKDAGGESAALVRQANVAATSSCRLANSLSRSFSEAGSGEATLIKWRQADPLVAALARHLHLPFLTGATPSFFTSCASAVTRTGSGASAETPRPSVRRRGASRSRGRAGTRRCKMPGRGTGARSGALAACRATPQSKRLGPGRWWPKQ
jgi:hypothetical protein